MPLQSSESSRPSSNLRKSQRLRRPYPHLRPSAPTKTQQTSRRIMITLRNMKISSTCMLHLRQRTLPSRQKAQSQYPSEYATERLGLKQSRPLRRQIRYLRELEDNSQSLSLRFLRIYTRTMDNI